MASKTHNKSLPPVPQRPSLKRSLTSIMSSFSRQPKTPRRAASWESWENRKPPTPQPHPWKHRPKVEVAESGGAALVDAQDAFTDSRRAVWTRILWSLPSEHDVQAQEVLGRISQRDVSESLASLGVNRYLELGRGAIFCNVGYNSGNLQKLAVDWVTFRDTQKTRDKLLQLDLLTNDPATSVLVYVFRLAQDKRSIAVWRKTILLPVNVYAAKSGAISRQKSRLAEREREYVIKISPAMEEMSRGSNMRRWASFTKRGVRA